MGLLDKLFGKKPAASGGGGRISLLALNLQQGQPTSTQKCGIDGRSFPCPKGPTKVITADTDRWAIDIGGYCDHCPGYRCHEHAKWVEVEPMTWMLGCARCGNPMRGTG